MGWPSSTTRLRIHNLARGVCRRSCLHLPNRVNGSRSEYQSRGAFACSSRYPIRCQDRPLSPRIPQNKCRHLPLASSCTGEALLWRLFNAIHHTRFDICVSLIADERQTDQELQVRRSPSGPRGLLRERLPPARARAAFISQVRVVSF